MDNEECMICLENLNDNLAVLSCNHVLHYRCLQNWINQITDIKKMCPICDIDVEITNIIENEPILESESESNNITNAITYYENSRNNHNHNKLKSLFACCNIL